jgi:hypothetical protein
VEEYVKGAKGNEAADEQFWNSFCKRGGTVGSGEETWFNGWMNIFFPFLGHSENKFMVPYSPDNNYVKEGRNVEFTHTS